MPKAHFGFRLVFWPDFGEGTAYAVESSNPAAVKALIREDLLIVSAAAGGETTLTLTATDPDGLSATLSFKVKVEQALRSRWGGWRSALLRQDQAGSASATDR